MDTNALFILYYSTWALSIIFYVYSAYKCGFKLATASNFAFVFAMLIIALPGFYVAQGTADQVIENSFNAGFDRQLYWLYFLFMPIASMGLILGQLAGKQIYIKTTPRKKMNSTIKLLFFLFSVYCFLYLLWLPQIPLNNLLFSSSFSFAEIYLQRIAITHGLGQIENLPIVFRYWRHVAQSILPALFYYLFITARIKHRNTLLILFLFLYILYLQIFTLEKAPFLYFLLGIPFLLYLRKQNEKARFETNQFRMIFRYGVGLTAIFVSLVFIYKYFVNVQDDVWGSLFLRLTAQSASDYLQIDYVRHIGFLGFSGIRMPILSSLLNLEYINPSKYAISIMYPSKVMGEIMGAAGGMSLTNLFYIMGWFSILIFLMLVFVFGYIDRVMINSIYHPVNKSCVYLNISFYAMLTLHYSFAVGSSVWNVFAIPTILSIPLIIIMAVYFFFVKIPKSIVVRKKLLRKILLSDKAIEKQNYTNINLKKI